MPLPGPFEAHRLKRRRLAGPSACALAAASLVGCGWGSGGIERASVSFVDGDGGGVAGRVLRSGVPTEDAELSLVRAALDLVPVSARPRPSVDGRAHFSSPGTSFYGLRLLRHGGVGPDEWRVDGEWALVELHGNPPGDLDGGLFLCWQGDLRLVLETLRVVLPIAASGTAGPRR